MKLQDDFVLSSLGCRPLHLHNVLCLCVCECERVFPTALISHWNHNTMTFSLHILHCCRDSERIWRRERGREGTEIEICFYHQALKLRIPQTACQLHCLGALFFRNNYGRQYLPRLGGCQWDGSFFFFSFSSTVGVATQIQQNKAAVLRCHPLRSLRHPDSPPQTTAVNNC